jgi:hypothetical protein
VNDTLLELHLVNNPLNAPRLIWKNVDSFRSPRARDALALLEGVRQTRRCYNAFAVVVGFNFTRESKIRRDDGLLSLHRMAMQNIASFLWMDAPKDSDLRPNKIEIDLEFRVRDLFGDSYDTCDVLNWFQKELRGLNCYADRTKLHYHMTAQNTVDFKKMPWKDSTTMAGIAVPSVPLARLSSYSGAKVRGFSLYHHPTTRTSISSSPRQLHYDHCCQHLSHFSIFRFFRICTHTASFSSPPPTPT